VLVITSPLLPVCVTVKVKVRLVELRCNLSK
jgi:hypothetical protein